MVLPREGATHLLRLSLAVTQVSPWTSVLSIVVSAEGERSNRL